MHLKHRKLRNIGLIAVVVGFLSFIGGSFVISLFGHTYAQYNDSPIAMKEVTGTTPMFWFGSAIVVFGIFSFVAVLFYFTYIGIINLHLKSALAGDQTRQVT